MEKTLARGKRVGITEKNGDSGSSGQKKHNQKGMEFSRKMSDKLRNENAGSIRPSPTSRKRLSMCNSGPIIRVQLGHCIFGGSCFFSYSYSDSFFCFFTLVPFFLFFLLSTLVSIWIISTSVFLQHGYYKIVCLIYYPMHVQMFSFSSVIIYMTIERFVESIGLKNPWLHHGHES